MADLPPGLTTRADVDRLLAAATNYEQVQPESSRSFDLARMERLLAALGAPHLGPRTLHVAGSKGKGGTCRMLAAALAHAGGPVGLTTSPHLVDLGERIEIDGVPLDDPGLVAAFAPLLAHVRRIAGGPDAPTFFELVTAAAWVAFRSRGCRWAVLETGLGGRLDATTVCRPEVVGITMIELEHVQLLGDTVERIAAEKAGILKPGVPCVTAAEGPALDVIAARARALDAPLTVVGRDVTVERESTGGPGGRPAVRVRLGGRTLRFVPPATGAHQARNAAVAAAMLAHAGLPDDAIVAGIAGARLPAALERFEGTPPVVLDGAHTEASARAAVEGLAEAEGGSRGYVLVLALLAEKRVDAILDALLPGARAVVATEAASPRRLAADELGRRVAARGRVPVVIEPEPRAALARARALAAPATTVLVTGSLYLAGALRPVLLADAAATAKGARGSRGS